MPSSLSFERPGMLPRTCHRLEVPKPHAAYASRSASTTIWRLDCAFLDGSGSDASHRSVDSWLLCETATKSTSGWAGAIARRLRYVFSATFDRVRDSLRREPGELKTRHVQGQPQCLRNVTIAGLSLRGGTISLGVAGAFSPTAGVSAAVCTTGGDIYDQNSLCQVIADQRRCM